MILSKYFLKTYNWCRTALSDDARTSLLSHAESDGIKGLLILLIVLGHNKYVMQGGMSNVFLYSFHVYAFYYLPFIYDFRNESWKRLITKNLRRLYVPYTLIFLLLTVLAYMQGTLGSLTDIGVAYVCGSQCALGQSFGMGSFLWFIPTMFMVMVYRKIYYALPSTWRWAMMCVSLISLVGFAYLCSWYLYLWWYAPMCMVVALGMIFPAVCLRKVCTTITADKIVVPFFLLFLSMMIFYPMGNNYPYTYLTVNRMVCPILIFTMLLSARHLLARNKWLVDFGRMSFRIYLIHIFIYNAIYKFADAYSPGIYDGLAIFGATFALSYRISKISFLKYAFPR